MSADFLDTSLRLIREALQRGQSVISFQVVQEFLSVATRKFAQPLSAEDLQDGQTIHGLTIANPFGIRV